MFMTFLLICLSIFEMHSVQGQGLCDILYFSENRLQKQCSLVKLINSIR